MCSRGNGALLTRLVGVVNFLNVSCTSTNVCRWFVNENRVRYIPVALARGRPNDEGRYPSHIRREYILHSCCKTSERLVNQDSLQCVISKETKNTLRVEMHISLITYYNARRNRSNIFKAIRISRYVGLLSL
jgi:hypothetical protein